MEHFETHAEFVTAADEPTHDEPRWLHVCVARPTRAGVFHTHLLEEIRASTRVEWPTLEVFWQFCGSLRPHAKIVLAIDDLHKWVDADNDITRELHLAVETFSRFDVVHWLICMNDRAYGDIASHTERLWGTYCDVQRNQLIGATTGYDRPDRVDLPRAGGWYRLDDIIEQDELGLEILRHITSTPLALDELGRLRLGARRELSNPLIASALATCAHASGHDISTLVNLRFVEFIRQLQDLLVARAVGEYRNHARGDVAQLLRQSIDYVARAFAISEMPEQPLEQLRQTVARLATGQSVLSDLTVVEHALTALDRAHLLEIATRPDSSGITEINWAGPRLDPFWEFHLARQELAVVDRTGTSDSQRVTQLQQWLESFNARRIKSGVAQFLLILTDTRQGELGTLLWESALAPGGLPLYTALFAATHCRAERQRSVASRLLNGSIRPDSTEDLVALIGFARTNEDGAMSLHERVQLLQPHFAAIGRAGLGDYCSFVLSTLITRINGRKQMQKVLSALNGAELLGAADELAQLCVDTMIRLLGEKNTGDLVDALLAYARNESRIDKGIRGPKGVDRFLFRHWVFDHGGHAIARQHQLATYDYLWSLGDGDARTLSVTTSIAIELEKFANFAITDIARHDNDLRRQFVEFIGELVERKTRKHRHNAFFLIRHTELIVEPDAPVHVDPVFHADLATIANDPRLDYLRKRFTTFFVANLGDPSPKRKGPPDEGKRRRRGK